MNLFFYQHTSYQVNGNCGILAQLTVVNHITALGPLLSFLLSQKKINYAFVNLRLQFVFANINLTLLASASVHVATLQTVLPSTHGQSKNMCVQIAFIIKTCPGCLI